MSIIKPFRKKKNYFKRRDYSIKSLRNPFYFKIDRESIKKKFNAILLIVIFSIIIYFFGYASFFKIQNIEVTGGGIVTLNFVKEMAIKQQDQPYLLIFSQDRLLFFKAEDFKKRVNQQLLLENIKVDKKWPRDIYISIIERFSEYYLTNQGQVFTLDNFGNLISVLDSLPASTTLPVLNFNASMLKIGDQVVNDRYLSEVNDIYESWKDFHLKPQIQYIQLNDKVANQLTVKTTGGFEIYFSREYDLNKQLNSYSNLYQTQIKNKQNISYIDFRIEDWIYYK